MFIGSWSGGLEGVFQAQYGDGLVEILNNLEALLAEEEEPVLDAVFRAYTDVGAAASHAGVSKADIPLVIGIGEAQHGIDGEGRAGGDDIVQIDVGIDGTQAVVLEEVHELGSDAEAVHWLYLQLEAKACHGVLGSVGELSACGDVTLLGACAKGGNDGQNGQEDEFFHTFKVFSP